MRILHLSDLHLKDVAFGPWLPCKMSLDELKKRIDDMKRTVREERLCGKSIGEIINQLFSGQHRSVIAALRLYIYCRSNQYDCIIISGDLCGTGRAEDIKVGVEFLRWLKGLGLRVFVVPGNHDVLSARGSPSAVEWYQHIGDGFLKGGIRGAVLTIGPVSVNLVLCDHTLDWQSLDIEKVGFFEKFGQGLVAGDSVYELQGVLGKLTERNPDGLTMIVSHFTPVYKTSSHLGLRGRKQLWNTVKKHRASMFLCGHTHEFFVREPKSSKHSCRTPVLNVGTSGALYSDVYTAAEINVSNNNRGGLAVYVKKLFCMDRDPNKLIWESEKSTMLKFVE